MRVTFENNTLTVVTEIKRDLVKNCTLTARDDKGNELYGAAFTVRGDGALDSYGIVGNVSIDGYLAFVKVMPEGYDLEKVKAQYGEALVAAANYTVQIATEAAAKATAIDDIFNA